MLDVSLSLLASFFSRIPLTLSDPINSFFSSVFIFHTRFWLFETPYLYKLLYSKVTYCMSTVLTVFLQLTLSFVEFINISTERGSCNFSCMLIRARSSLIVCNLVVVVLYFNVVYKYIRLYTSNTPNILLTKTL